MEKGNKKQYGKPYHIGRSWRDNKKGYDEKDYVPLSERKDWDGKVEKLK